MNTQTWTVSSMTPFRRINYQRQDQSFEFKDGSRQ
jgi:hypothetical protein